METENGYQPSPEELKKAEEAMDVVQEAESESRSFDLEKLTPEQEKLLAKCQFYSGTRTSRDLSFYGTVDGHRVVFVREAPQEDKDPKDDNFANFFVVVDNHTIEGDEAKLLFNKFKPIAEVQHADTFQQEMAAAEDEQGTQKLFEELRDLN